MSRAVLILSSSEIREKAIRWIRGLPDNTRIEFKKPKRSLPQNAKLWAMLTEVSEQVVYHGLRLTPDDWKLLFLDSLRREVRNVPNLDGNGIVSLGRSSSDLSKDEFGDLLEIIYAYGAHNDVVFSDPIRGPNA